MKRLIYITYLGLLALLLMSCEKDTIAPADAMNISGDNLKKGTCSNYQFNLKNGVVNLGLPRTDIILVGFMANMPMAQKQVLLSQHAIFDQISGEFPTESGLATIVQLKSNATCSAAIDMITALERKPQVIYASPSFNDSFFTWKAPNNQIWVTLNNASQVAQFRHLLRMTRTTVVEEITPVEFIVSTDKHAAGDALYMTSYFNSSPIVAYADPDYVWQHPGSGARTSRNKQIALVQ